jgi:hypothetical protein
MKRRITQLTYNRSACFRVRHQACCHFHFLGSFCVLTLITVNACQQPKARATLPLRAMLQVVPAVPLARQLGSAASKMRSVSFMML